MDALREDGEAAGQPSTIAGARWQQAQIAYQRGDLARCEAEARAAVEIGGAVLRPLADPWRVLALVEQGRLDEAERLVPEAIGPSGLLQAAVGSRGRLRLAQGDFARAIDDLAEARDRGAAYYRLRVEPPWQPLLAEALVLAGRPAEAAAEADAYAEAAAHWGTPRAQGQLARMRALAAPRAQAIALLEQAAGHFAQTSRSSAPASSSSSARGGVRRVSEPPPARRCARPSTPRTRAARPHWPSAPATSSGSSAAGRGRPRAPSSRPPSAAWPTSRRAARPTARSRAGCSSRPRRSRCTCAASTASSTSRAARVCVQGPVQGERPSPNGSHGGMLGGMRVDEYSKHDALGLRELMTAGEVTADEIETAARRALDDANARVNGLAAPLFTPALEHAPDGPLAGVPFLYKDFGPMAKGVPFYGGIRGIRGIRPAHDSDLMRRVRTAGLRTLGLTTSPELGMSLSTEPVRTGPTRNPHDPTRSAGGSSGGSAALVATGAVPIAHGSDGAGSIRVPASCCGVIGLKPTRGRTPCGPDIGEALFGLSEHFGVTRTLRDTAAYLDAIHGPSTGDKYFAPLPPRPFGAELGVDPGRLRVALWTDAAEPEAAAAAQRAAHTLEQHGHTVEPATPPVDEEAVVQMLVAGQAVVAEPLLNAPRIPPAHMLEAVTNAILAQARTLTALELMDALAAQNRVSRAVGAFFEDVDLIVSPTLPGLPAQHGTLDYDNPEHTPEAWVRKLHAYSPFTAAFNVTGQPAISLPLATSASGLPIGVQLVAGYGREDVLLRVASQLMPAG